MTDIGDSYATVEWLPSKGVERYDITITVNEDKSVLDQFKDVFGKLLFWKSGKKPISTKDTKTTLTGLVAGFRYKVKVESVTGNDKTSGEELIFITGTNFHVYYSPMNFLLLLLLLWHTVPSPFDNLAENKSSLFSL